MYKRILLASDGARESLIALREGALIAGALGAEVWLLIIDAPTTGQLIADGVHPTPRAQSEPAAMLLAQGLSRLQRLGVRAEGEWVSGEPAALIAERARSFQADLVVVGHRRKTLLERWWSGADGAYLADRVACSVLLARNVISDAEFEARPTGVERPLGA